MPSLHPGRQVWIVQSLLGSVHPQHLLSPSLKEYLMTLRNIPLSILGKVLLELVAQGLLFNAVYDERSETFTITLTGGY